MQPFRKSLWFAIYLLALTGCGGSPSKPTTPLKKFKDASSSQHFDSAYSLLSNAAKSRRSKKAIAKLWQRNRKELDMLSEQLARATESRDGPLIAEVTGSRGQTFRLVWEDGAWRIHGGVLDAIDSNSPTDTVRALKHSLETQNLPGFLALLSRSTKAELQHTITGLIMDLSEPDTLILNEKNDEVHVETPNGYRIHLVNEQGSWRVKDIEIALPSAGSPLPLD